MSPKKRGRRPSPRKSRPSPQRAAPATGGAAPGPAGGRAPFYTPGGSNLRRAVERTTAPLLLTLTQLPRFVVMFAPLVLLLLGFFLPLAPGLIALGIFLLLTVWLAYLSWPRADARARVLRLVMFALVIALIALRVTRS